VLGGVSLYLVLPSLLAVFGSWRSLSHLEWPFAILALACEGAAFACLWELDRIALHTSAWFPVATAQLSGNAAGRLLPGGGATATAVSATMLRRVGIDTGEAAAAFGASSALQVGTTLALPILALPAILGGAAINHDLAAAAYLGIVVLVLLVAGTVAAFASDRPLELVGRLSERVLNATVRRRKPVTDLPQELLADRDSIRAALGGAGRRPSPRPPSTPASTTSRSLPPSAQSARNRVPRSSCSRTRQRRCSRSSRSPRAVSASWRRASLGR
jgi:hypothetical protein